MSIAVSSRFTYRCPLATLNVVRWSIGIASAFMWFRVGFVLMPHDEFRWLLLAAVVSTQAFGTTSSGLLLLRPRRGLLGRLTDWYAIVASTMTWVLGVAAVIWHGISWPQGILLFISVSTGIAWLALIYFGLFPIHLGAIERE